MPSLALCGEHKFRIFYKTMLGRIPGAKRTEEHGTGDNRILRSFDKYY
jgi:hypothetical protein